MVQVIFYKEVNGSCPAIDFLQTTPARVQAKAKDRIELLKDQGHQLRRPHADYLRNDIYELRWRWQRVNYRILYFFYGRTAVVLTNALTKEGGVPDAEINRAIRRKQLFEANPQEHIY